MNVLSAFFTSRKTIDSLLVSIIVTVPMFLFWGDWSKDERAERMTYWQGAMVVVWGIKIGGTALEDYGQKKSGTQLNIGSTVDNTKVAPSEPVAESSPEPTTDELVRENARQMAMLLKMIKPKPQPTPPTASPAPHETSA